MAPRRLREILALFLVLVSGFLCSSSQASGAERTVEHPIDKARGQCIEKSTGDNAHALCNSEAIAQWEREIDGLYGKLVKELDEQGRAALRESQKQWKRFRDRERELNSKSYGKLDGTMFELFHSEANLAVVRDRAFRLSALLEHWRHGRGKVGGKD